MPARGLGKVSCLTLAVALSVAVPLWSGRPAPLHAHVTSHWTVSGPWPGAPGSEQQPFVAPAATVKVATEVRTLSSEVTDEKKFKGGVISPRILIDNPYLDVRDPFFNIPRQIACLPDGSVAVFSTAKLHKDGYLSGTPYASGVWRIAPDGAITPIAAKPPNGGGISMCGVPFAQSAVETDIGPVSTAPDGSLLFAYETTVLRLTPDGRIEHVPHKPQYCVPGFAPEVRARFEKPEAAAQDAHGNVWVSDVRACTVSRIAPDGGVTSVLGPGQVCPQGEPENWVRGEFMAWDAVHDELVMSGTVLWLKAPKANLYSMIWRLRPDGTARRVFLGVKLGKTAPRVDGISGVALDANGTIYFGAGIGASGGGYQVMRLNEAKGTPEVVAGAPRPTDVNLGDGPARQAHFGTVRSMCFVPDGTLFVNDANHVIRKLTTAGQVTTWAF